MTFAPRILLLLLCGGAAASDVKTDASVSLVQKRAGEVLASEDNADDDDLAEDYTDEVEDAAELYDDIDMSDDEEVEVDCIGGWIPGDSWSRDTPAEPRYTNSKEECVQAVKNSCPEANGVTWHGAQKKCFCEFDSCGVAHADGGWESALHCLMRKVPVAKPDAEGCIGGWKPGDASHMVKELKVDGGASSASECLAKVRKQYGDQANGATYFPPSKCWGEVNQSGYTDTGGGYDSARNCWFGYWCGDSKKEQSGPAPAPEPTGGAPAPAPTGICRSKCNKQYNKFVKKGKEGLGFKKICKKSFCVDCPFCQGDFPTSAPTAPCRRSCMNTYEKFVKKGKEAMGKEKVCKNNKCSGCDLCAEEQAPAPAPEEQLTFNKVQDDRYWGCTRKGMGNLHGFGHSSAQECFEATLNDPECKGQFDYNQGYNGQCKCVTADDCTALKGLRGYVAYEAVEA